MSLPTEQYAFKTIIGKKKGKKKKQTNKPDLDFNSFFLPSNPSPHANESGVDFAPP